MVPLRVPVDILRVGSFDVQARQEKRQFIYEGVSSVKEIEVQESDGDSEDNVPIAAVLRKKKECTNSLTLEQIQDCEVGPKDEKAVGKTVATIFDGVEYRGTVDSWRSTSTGKQRSPLHRKRSLGRLSKAGLRMELQLRA